MKPNSAVRRSPWTRFWHEPVRAERLALARILLAFALLAEQLTRYLPNLELLFGSTGYAPSGWLSELQHQQGRWTASFFDLDNALTLHVVFFVWVTATTAMLVGWWTRIATALTWFGALCFANRNPWLLNHGDHILLIGLFVLMLSPCGRAWSLDRKQNRDCENQWIEPWPVRFLQIQLALLYFSTGLAKTLGTTWWDGTSIHYVLLDPARMRWPVESFYLPYWLTACLTWGTLLFELTFWLLVLFRKTRTPILIAGIAFHVGIVLVMEVGWFSFYVLAMYGVWYEPRRGTAAAGDL